MHIWSILETLFDVPSTKFQPKKFRKITGWHDVGATVGQSVNPKGRKCIVGIYYFLMGIPASGYQTRLKSNMFPPFRPGAHAGELRAIGWTLSEAKFLSSTDRNKSFLW